MYSYRLWLWFSENGENEFYLSDIGLFIFEKAQLNFQLYYFMAWFIFEQEKELYVLNSTEIMIAYSCKT